MAPDRFARQLPARIAGLDRESTLENYLKASFVSHPDRRERRSGTRPLETACERVDERGHFRSEAMVRGWSTG